MSLPNQGRPSSTLQYYGATQVQVQVQVQVQTQAEAGVWSVCLQPQKKEMLPNRTLRGNDGSLARSHQIKGPVGLSPYEEITHSCPEQRNKK